MDTSVMGGRGRAVRVALIVAGLTGVASLVSGCQSDPDIDITAYAQTIEPADVLYNQGWPICRPDNSPRPAASSRPSTSSIPIRNMPARRW
jgi:hypothetical protein